MRNDAKNKPLGQVASVRLGYPFRGSIPEVPSGSVSVIQTRNVFQGMPVDYSRLLTTELDTRREPEWLQNLDLLFVSRGSKNFVVLISNPPPRTICSPHFYVLRVKDSARLLPEFLVWQLNQLPAQTYLRQSAEGSAQLSIRRAVLEGISIRVLPLVQQRSVLQLVNAAEAERNALKTLILNREVELNAVAERLLG
jgi:hypothetical protein